MKKPHSLSREKKTIAAMLKIYCHSRHPAPKDRLCPGCEDLLQYALQRLDNCPFGPEKGPCAECTIHCYEPSMRLRIQEVMRYSGPRILKKNPVLAICHLLKKWKTN